MNEYRSTTVADVGELELVARIRARIGEPAGDEKWAGDDAAILQWPDDKLLMTTDMMVEGLDFDLSYAGGRDVGWKSVAVNVSDIASMGGRPSHAVAAVGLPPQTPLRFVDDFLDGLVEAAGSYGLALVGGDVSAAPAIVVTIALVGAAPSPPIERSGARPGDALCVTGSLGGAAAGLVALRRGLSDDDPAIARLKERQLRPRARVDEAVALLEFAPTAMIDVSDGLAVDLGNIVDASEIGCEVEAGAVPVDPDLGAIGDIDPFELAVLGGEDFELLVTLPPAQVDAAVSRLASEPAPLKRIGTVTRSGAKLGDRSLEEWRSRGWEHLRAR